MILTGGGAFLLEGIPLYVEEGCILIARGVILSLDEGCILIVRSGSYFHWTRSSYILISRGLLPPLEELQRGIFEAMES